MTPEQFVYWLQGYMEMANPTELDPREVKIIRDHLQEVFKKVTPNYNGTGIQFSPQQLQYTPVTTDNTIQLAGYPNGTSGNPAQISFC